MLGLEGMLRKLGGLQEGFVETVLLPQMHHAIGRLSIFHSHEPSDNESHPELPNDSEAFELIAKMKIHSNTQSVSTGKTVLREVKKATYALPPIADDLVALNRKFATFKKNLDACGEQTDSALVGMLEGIKTLPLSSSSLSAISSTNSSRVPTPIISVLQFVSRSRSLSSTESIIGQQTSGNNNISATCNISSASANTTTNTKSTNIPNTNTSSWIYIEGIQKLIPSFGSLSLNQNKHS